MLRGDLYIAADVASRAAAWQADYKATSAAPIAERQAPS